MAAAQPDAGSSGPRGAPIRFLVTILCLWASARFLMMAPLFPGAIQADAHPVAALHGAARGHIAATIAVDSYYGGIVKAAPSVPARRLDHIPIIRVDPADVHRTSALQRSVSSYPRSMMMRASAPAASLPLSVAGTDAREGMAPVVSGIPLGRPPARQRWSGSVWMLWRDNTHSGASGATGQLGGAQAGLRVARVIGRLDGQGVPVAAYVRLSGALHDPVMPEAALGIAISPLSGAMPLSIGLERRIALGKDARNAFALVLAGGLNPTRLAGPLTAEGYAQAGVVGFSRADPFIDGRFALTAPLDRNGRIRLGAAISGGAQPGLSRLDLGPAIEARLPLGRVHPRLVLEWRHRVAGNARPDSGLAVTLASDF